MLNLSRNKFLLINSFWDGSVPGSGTKFTTGQVGMEEVRSEYMELRKAGRRRQEAGSREFSAENYP